VLRRSDAIGKSINEDVYMGYSGTVMFLHPLSLLVIAAVLLILTFAIVYTMKRVFKLSKEEIDGSFASLVFSAWAINLVALALAQIIMDFITFSIPYFDIIYAEFRSSLSNSYLPELIYITLSALLYAALLLSSYPAFRAKIANKANRNKMFIVFVISSALIWAIIMCLGMGVFSRL
jgi:hypothetical protein